jgi:hypothetical protein
MYLNLAPELVLPANSFNAVAGVNFTFTATATDPDGPNSKLTFSLLGAPADARIDPKSGVFSWMPTSPGSVSFSVTVTDSSGLTDTEPVTINVAKPLPTSPLVISDATVSRDKKNIIVTMMLISNPNANIASNVSVNVATLNDSTTLTRLPLKVGSINPGSSSTVSLSFNKDLPSGKATLYIQGSSSLGDFSRIQFVIVP